MDLVYEYDQSFNVPYDITGENLETMEMVIMGPHRRPNWVDHCRNFSKP